MHRRPGASNSRCLALVSFIAVLLTGLFYQGNWQRVHAARDNRALRTGFLPSGPLSTLMIFPMGLLNRRFDP
ncbi:hypothetical protein [Pistricoccus aurantiacus]|uniref:Uncharacterized protein n=1 Tax=Pistricoccus aurantiacus TaxID=1883414 RepID=A0A5B8SS83_9GAMM|nr:hypothetical protein [Pistricoccus aurantiacus]QEA39124.1 hypothetical protein FGL86_08585 [Pistricoccus aurantiacus]